MKVIDLLNKIANGEEVPKKIKYHNRIYIKRSDCYNYILENGGFDDELKVIVGCLNDEVEIIEEDEKIRKLPKEVREPKNFEEVVYIAEDLASKINEIIDYLEKENK